MWQPGVPVTSETPLEPLLCAIGFGLQDVASYQTIAEKLKTRSVSTVGDLFGSGASWQREEVLACFRTLELKKTPLSYVGAIDFVHITCAFFHQTPDRLSSRRAIHTTRAPTTSQRCPPSRTS